ncbi:MAG: hypothetical protein IJD78_07055 [Clostridia bacterium]|nr:hypothetical protein [Clostridia bacterium]
MKRIIAVLSIVVLLFSSCSGNNETPKNKTADMLDITNTDADFFGCVSRMESVLSAMKAKVNVLENAHNNSVKANADGEYFLENDYVLTSFEPFVSETFGITQKFASVTDKENAGNIFREEANGKETFFDTDGKSFFSLRFLSETTAEEYSVEYNEKADSFRYIFNVEETEGTETREFLEFISGKDGVYIIQSRTTRCIIEFNGEDEIVRFCCGELRNGEFSTEESVFGNDDNDISESWVIARGKSEYSNIHTYSDGVLTHEDCSSGPWKSVKIRESDYASAFYAQP